MHSFFKQSLVGVLTCVSFFYPGQMYINSVGSWSSVGSPKPSISVWEGGQCIQEFFRENLTDTQPTLNKYCLFSGTPGKLQESASLEMLSLVVIRKGLRKWPWLLPVSCKRNSKTHMKIILFEIISLCLNGNWAGKSDTHRLGHKYLFWEITCVSQSDITGTLVISLWGVTQCTEHSGSKGLRGFEDYITNSWLQPVNMMIMCKYIYMHTCMDEQQWCAILCQLLHWDLWTRWKIQAPLLEQRRQERDYLFAIVRGHDNITE